MLALDFLTARGGNVAMMFGLFLFPLVLAAGATIDINRLQTAKGQVESSLDAATLYVARQTSLSTDVARSEAAKKFFVANINVNGLVIDKINVKKTGDTYAASFEGSLPTTFLGAVGVKTLDLTQGAKVKLGEASFEIALALDTTGSMEGEKLTELKKAAKQLVTDLDAAFTDANKLKFSVVPFATYVNVGPDKDSTTWMDTNADSSVHGANFSISSLNRFDLFDHLGVAWSGCVESRPMPYDVTDDKANGVDGDTYFVPVFHPDETDDTSNYANTYLTDSTTSGSLLDDIRHVGKYGIDPSTGATPWSPVSMTPNYKYYSDTMTPIGPNFNCGTRPITPLTTSRTTVQDEIEALVAEGSTNMTEGVMWAWRTLTPEAPYKEGANKKHVRKVIVLLSDGNNHVNEKSDDRGSEYFSYGYLAENRLGINAGSTQDDIYTAMDDRMKKACENIKNGGVEVYTIRLDLAGDARSQTLLKNCASDDDHFLDVPSPTDLKTAFSQIAQDIMMLHISE